MADKFIIHGATFNGDGTASNEAASAGAPGAWNNINIFAGTTPANGSLDAGDAVYIRSKTSAGADITVTLSASISIGSANATSTSKITWILDNGTTWSGISGILKYECPSTYIVTVLAFNDMISLEQDALRIVEMNTSANQKTTLVLNQASNNRGFFVDISAVTGAAGSRLNISGTYGYNPIYENLHIKTGSIWSTYLIYAPRATRVTLISPDFELVGVPLVTSRTVIGSAADGGIITIYGGQVRGVGATTGQTLITTPGAYQQGLNFFGFNWPRTMTLLTTRPSSTSSASYLSALGADDGAGGVYVTSWGSMSSRADNNPPYLNAILPDSGSTGWAWLIDPSGATPSNPGIIPFGKYYTETAATKTLTLELLQSTVNVGANKRTLWMSVNYVDTSGSAVCVTTQDGGDAELDSSVATWLPSDTWGAISFTKHKLSVTTPTAIKQDTLVTITLSFAYERFNADDVMFVCPDVLMS